MSKLQVCLLVTYLCGLSGGLGSRGPHHPRGTAQTHKHYRPYRPQGAGEAAKITQDAGLLHDTDHIREDLGEWAADATRNMTPEELEFHYFQLHDFDNNTKLDGLEILQAIHHTMHENEGPSGISEDHGHSGGDLGDVEHKQSLDEPSPEQQQDDLVYFVELIDRVLAEDDLDHDGYLSYVEYVVGRQRDDKRRTTQKKSR